MVTVLDNVGQFRNTLVSILLGCHVDKEVNTENICPAVHLCLVM